MAKKLKFLLTVDDVNHRVFADVKQSVNSVTFHEFQNVIRNCYDQFVPFLDPNCYSLEIFDKDFEEYVKLNENEPIEDKSKLRAKRINSSTTSQPNESHPNLQTNTFNQVESPDCQEIVVESKNATIDAIDAKLKQLNVKSNALPQPQPAKRKTIQKAKENREVPVKIQVAQKDKPQSLISIGAKDANSENLLKMNPFFQKFSKNECLYQNHETIVPPSHDEHAFQSLPQNLQSQRIPSSNGSSSRRSSEKSLEDVLLKVAGKKRILKSNFRINDYDKKLGLINTLLELGTAKGSLDESNSAFWKKVSKSLAKKGINYEHGKCRGVFMGLLGQYFNILKNMKDITAEEAQNLWPFFNLFHYELKLLPFKVDVVHMKAAFNEHPKNNTVTNVLDNAEYIPAARPFCDCHENNFDTLMDCPVVEDDNTDIVLKSIERLMKAVSDNSNDLKEDKLDEDQFWQKIAYEMFAFKDPVDEGSNSFWKTTFFTLLRQFLWKEPDSIVSSDVLGKLFEPMEIEIFMNTNDKEMCSLLAGPQIASSEIIADLCEDLTPIEETNDEIMRFQHAFLRSVRKLLKFVTSHPSDGNRRFWSKIRQKLLKKGYELESEDDLRAYLLEFIAVYYKALQSCSNSEEARQRWPVFNSIHNLDLSAFVNDINYYQDLKRKFD